MKTYKIGTRGSLLAVTQSTLMKNRLEEISGEKFELVLIKTQGDEITNVPLWQLDGKDFFTKELDTALLKGEVDCVIHSYKDLGSERPIGIQLAAITERRFAHDILLIKKDVIAKLKNWQGDFIVGTSSPRRIANLTHSLKDFIPYALENKLHVRCETLRGNVNTRIKKLRDDNYHAITLALAGIERLAHTEKSAAELRELLDGLDYFILPQSIFPTAASQGALGIEIKANRDDQGKLLSYIEKLAHAETAEEVKKERIAFKEYGGGCHLAVGIHVKRVKDYFLHIHAGEVDGKRIEKKWLEGYITPQIDNSKKLFIGLPLGERSEIVYDEFLLKRGTNLKLDLKNKHVFVTSKYAKPTLINSQENKQEGLWAAGTKTAKRLAQKGFWVNGTSDSMGIFDLKMFKTSLALEILHPHLQESWVTLSHYNGESELGKVYAAYERFESTPTPSYIEELKEVGACYWTSFLEYEAFMRKFPFLKEAKHFCGLGKTWEEFENANVEVLPLASMSDFYSLIK